MWVLSCRLVYFKEMSQEELEQEEEAVQMVTEAKELPQNQWEQLQLF